MKSVSYIPKSARLLDQLREVLRYKYYSLRTEEAYVYWAKFFVRWHVRNGQMRHPRDMGATEVQQFLSMLTTQRNVSVSTHNQALSALLFLYREVVGVQLPWLEWHAILGQAGQLKSNTRSRPIQRLNHVFFMFLRVFYSTPTAHFSGLPSDSAPDNF